MYSIQRRRRTSGKQLSALMMMVIIATQFAMLVGPSVAHADTILNESFGTGSTLNDIPAWEEQGNDNDSDVVAQAPSNSGEDTASPNGGRFAKIQDGEWICAEVNATGLYSLELSYYWRGDNDAEDNDSGKVEYKLNGNCDSGNWSQLKSHNLDVDNSWSTQTAFALPASLENKSFHLRFRADASSNDEYFRVDGINLTGTPPAPVDVCENVSGTQTETPCADDTCEQQGGLWNNNTCTPDACPNVTGHQSTGTCADELCTQQQGTWNGNSCDLPVDICPSVDGLQTEGQCANDVCTENGGIWSENSCIPDACPNVTGHQTDTPCADTLCVENGGTWTNNECDMPTAQESCQTAGDFWNGEACEDVAQCTEVQTYNSENNTCIDPQPEVCPEGQVGTPPNCTTPEVEEDIDLCPEEGLQSELPCATVTAETPTNTNTAGSNGGGGNGPIAGTNFGGPSFAPGFGGGSVLGASTTTVDTGASCSPIVTSYMRMGKDNNPEQVKALQAFLNKELGLTLEVNGVFGTETYAAVKAFQEKYSKEILGPWGISKATGYVYKTTTRWINMLSCSSLEIPMPELN